MNPFKNVDRKLFVSELSLTEKSHRSHKSYHSNETLIKGASDELMHLENVDARKLKKMDDSLCHIIEDDDKKFDECFRQLLDIRDGKDGHQWQS